MLRATPGYDRTPCPDCGHAHNIMDYGADPEGRLLERNARKEWVTEQPATERYTYTIIKDQDWWNGDTIIDRDGDAWMFWNDYWHPMPERAQSLLPAISACGNAFPALMDNYETMQGLPNYEPYAVWHVTPRVKPPTFASVQEAEEWLEAHS